MNVQYLKDLLINHSVFSASIEFGVNYEHNCIAKEDHTVPNLLAHFEQGILDLHLLRNHQNR